MRLPHPIQRRRAEQQQRARRVEQAVRKSGLRNRAPQAYDWADELRRRQQMGRWDR